MDVVSVPSHSWSLIFRLALAMLLGAAVGLNRELSLKPAGLRTHALVSLGAALLTLTGLMLAESDSVRDLAAPGRIIQGIVAGIGFIGGGVILHRGAREVRGLTTAASIWIVAATGVAVGAGLWRSALAAVGLSLAMLIAGLPIDRAVRRHRGDVDEDEDEHG
jgi:putative Mg2+ transporter-C (MgtC) family protein